MYILHHTRLQICTLIKLILDFLVNYDMWRNSVTKASHATSGGCVRTHGGVIAKSGFMALWPCGNERAVGDCKRQPCGFMLMSECAAITKLN